MNEKKAQHMDGRCRPETQVQASRSAQDVCVVCLEPISERAVASPCNHCSFDFHCLINWAELRASCPLCNSAIQKIEYDWRSSNDYKVYRIPATAKTNEKNNRLAHDRQSRRSFRRSGYTSRRSRFNFQPDVALQRRKYIYNHNLYSLHVGSNRLSQYRDFTPAAFAADSNLQSRARAWIRRELRVFSFLSNTSNAAIESKAARSSGRNTLGMQNSEFLLEYIIAILRTVDLYGPAGQAEEMLQEFLGREHAKLFLHELNAWLRSPYAKIEDWDRMVQYRERLPLNCSQGREGLLTVI